MDPSIQFLNKVSSYVEIYNETIHDLLDPATPPCTLREDLKRGGTFVQGATEFVIEVSQDAADILQIGTRNRTTAETAMNERSSRSHSILTLNIQTKTTANEITSVKEARINLVRCSSLFNYYFQVDLAGSERQKVSSTSGDRLREGNHINKSLMTLVCIKSFN